MYEVEKKSTLKTTNCDAKEDQRMGRWKREKVTGPSIFIAKTYEILEVTTKLLRKTPTLTS